MWKEKGGLSSSVYSQTHLSLDNLSSEFEY